MPYSKIDTIWFAESTNPAVTHYEIDVMKEGYILGSPQIVDKNLSVNGEIDIRLNAITELPSDALGLYSIYIYAVDPLGRSNYPLNLFNLDLNFLLLNPTAQDKTGILLKNATQPYYASLFSAGDR